MTWFFWFHISLISNTWSITFQFEDEQNKFDAIIAYNTLGVWHGIGGFGHPGYSVINPWADAVTLSKAWCLSKKQSRAMLALPMTHDFLDLITFNAGKFYGRHQLAHLFTNWKQAPENYDYVETMKKYFTAIKVDYMQKGHRYLKIDNFYITFVFFMKC